MAQFLSRLRSRWRWLIGLLLGLLVLVAALPSVCQYDPARRWLLGAAFGKVNGDVAVDRVSFGWFSPPALYGLKIVDRQSKPVVTLVAAQGDTPLWRILMRPHAPGTFHFEQPRVHLVLREDGTTNLKQVFGENPFSDSVPLPQLAIQFSNHKRLPIQKAAGGKCHLVFGVGHGYLEFLMIKFATRISLDIDCPRAFAGTDSHKSDTDSP